MRTAFPARGRRIIATLAAVFFFAPLALWVLGVGADGQNTGAAFPSSFTSWGWIDEMRAYVDDQLPIRSTAVRWRAEATRALFNEAPPGAGVALDEGAPRADDPTGALPEGTSDIVLGKDRWMFLTSEFALACAPKRTDDAIADDLRAVAEAVEASDRTVFITVAPDKSAIEQDHLPDDDPYRACAAKGHSSRFAALRDADIPGYIDMHDRLAQLERQGPAATYLRGDSHWSGVATAEMAEVIVEGIDSALLEDTTFEQIEYEYPSDLSRVLGVPVIERGPEVRVRRSGVEVTRVDNAFGAHIRGFTSRATPADASSAAIAPEKVLLIGDSFALGLGAKLAPFVESLTYLHNFDLARDQELFERELRSATVVVVVMVERYAAAGVSKSLARVLVPAARGVGSAPANDAAP